MVLGSVWSSSILFSCCCKWGPIFCTFFRRSSALATSGETVEGTPELDRRHEVLEAHCHDYLSSPDATYLGLTEERLLELEAEFDPGERPTITCDGCGTETIARISSRGEVLKPAYWYQRSDEDGIQTACSRDCIRIIGKRTGKTMTVMPF